MSLAGMRTARALMLGVAGSAMVATGAMAADPFIPADPPVAAAPAFDWDRAYIGVYVGDWLNCCGFGMVGVVAGKNFAIGGSLVAGIDISFGAYDFGAIEWEGYALARAGFTLGGRVLAYGGLGIGWSLPTDFVPAATVGVEAAMRDDFAVRAELLFYDVFNGPDIAVRVSVNRFLGGN